MLHLVIMAGGSGTRFWPESRRGFPKQFLSLAGDRSLIQQAADRCRDWIPAERMHVVTNAALAGETARQLPQLSLDNILLEPCGRNTAPCIGLAAIHVSRLDSDAVLLVAPADHLIRPADAFRATVQTAIGVVEEHPDASVLFGIPPTYPATGYGYVECGDVLPLGQATVYSVDAFREKPTRDVAETFLESGGFYWNSGIFVWRAEHILALLDEFQPAISLRLKRLADATSRDAWQRGLESEFPGMPSISIDYGVLEPAAARAGGSAVFVVPASFEWDDVGSWQALPAVLGKDAAGNTITGPHCGLDTSDCIIRTTADHLIATIGLSDFVVVHTADATLIAPRNDETALRKLVALLEERGYERFL